jgi:hypothetical protein
MMIAREEGGPTRQKLALSDSPCVVLLSTDQTFPSLCSAA